MIQLHDTDTGILIGTISEAQLEILIDRLEEESRDDQDYYINEVTLEVFEQEGVDAGLVGILRTALAGRADMEIRWSRI